jgi:hypothetical protein
LDERHKLDASPIDEGPRPKNDKLRLNSHGTILEGKPNWLELKKRVQKGESS